jgi:hypothetical protein
MKPEPADDPWMRGLFWFARLPPPVRRAVGVGLGLVLLVVAVAPFVMSFGAEFAYVYLPLGVVGFVGLALQAVARRRPG